MTPAKVMTIGEAARLVRAAQAGGHTVAMCHGCFDLVHPGHIRHLQHAAKLADRLLVTVTGDAAMNKGPGRPLIPQELRAENLAAIDCVDWVAIHGGPTAVELLERIRPDFYVKGREYEHNRDPRFQQERQTVERQGGRVVFSSGDVTFSSTALIGALNDGADPVPPKLKRFMAQNGLSQAQLDGLINSFGHKRVLVIGEAIIDTYVLCDRPEVASESPILTLRPLEQRRFDGGAAIIARDVAEMGGQARLLTALPRSVETSGLVQRLNDHGVQTQWAEVEAGMVEKRRFLVGAAKMLKLDLGGPVTLNAADQERFIQHAADSARESDAVIIADFGQGLFTPTMLTRLCHTLRPLVPLMIGDVSGRRSNLLAMRSMDLMCPNETEIRDALHEHGEGLSSVVWRLVDATRTKAVIATLGQEGLIAFEPLQGTDVDADDWRTRMSAQHLPALAPHAIDQLGCGDALLASATLALAAGGSLAAAALLGSIAAAAQAQRFGNAVVSAHDLRSGLRQLSRNRVACSAEPPAITIAPAFSDFGHQHDQLSAAHA